MEMEMDEDDPRKIMGFAEVASPRTGGQSSIGSVTLTSNAPSGGTVVSLTSSDTNVAAVPPSTTVAEGTKKSPTFPVTTFDVVSSTQVIISGTVGTNTISGAILTVNPI